MLLENNIIDNDFLFKRKEKIEKVCIKIDEYKNPIKISHKFENTNVLNLFRVIYSDNNKI